MLVIPDRVHRCHNSIFLSLVWEYRHLILRIKRLTDFSFRISGFFHNTITVGLLHGSGHDSIYLFLSQIPSERSCFLLRLFFEETRLQIFSYVLTHSFFGIALHTWVECGVNLQSVCIYIIVRTIFLLILGTPTKQRIIFPRQRIFIIFLHLPAAIFTLLRLLGCHYPTQIFTEVSCQTFLVVHTTILQHQR